MNSNERNCDKCVYGRRSGNCTAWNCKGTVTVEDIKAEARQSVIDVIIKSLEVEFLMQNNPNSKFVETIVLHRDFIDALEQLKEGENNGKTRFNG